MLNFKQPRSKGRGATERKTAKMAKVLKIPARGDWRFDEVELEGDGGIPLKTLQDAVGGWIELWSFSGFDMFIHEEGKLRQLPFNPVATRVSGILSHGDCIVGNAIVCAHDGEGKTIGLSDGQVLELRRMLRESGF